MGALLPRRAQVLPTTTICFSVAPLVALYNAGDAEPILWNVAAGSLVCLVGLLTFKGDVIIESIKRS